MMGVLSLLLASACLLIPATIYLLPSISNAPPPRKEWEPIACTDGNGTSSCTVTNSYGSFPDRAVCHAAAAVYPRTEAELVAAVAAATATKRKAKVVTRYSHSITKLACPGGQDGNVAISTRWLNRTVHVDIDRRLLTVESGMVLRDLVEVAAAAGLALPNSPYWNGLTIGGLMATGAHGSSLWGKGSAVHEYVVGMRIVTPAPASQGFAVVREIGADHPDLDAAKVSLGVLGVISQVTLALEPQFKRSLSFVTRDDSDLAKKVSIWGRLHEFGDMIWLPYQREVVYREDDRVNVSTPGDGHNDFLLFRSHAKPVVVAARLLDSWLEETHAADTARCLMARLPLWKLQREAYGFTNDGASFMGYPVVGFLHRIQASSSCLDTTDDGAGCSWDPRLRGGLHYNSAFSVGLSKAPAFVSDMQRLRDLNPHAFCGLEGKLGVLMRYVRASSAFLGKAEDSVDFDIVYYRSHTEGVLRRHADVVDEIEQMALHKYGAVPHWGKNRNFAFDGAITKYPKAGEFLKVKDRYDPDGIFSSEWSDQVLGVKGSPSILRNGCAIEGLCVCSLDSHCAPDKGYFCRPGKVYKDARVCMFDGATGAALR